MRVVSASEGEKLRLKKAGYSFMDITDHPDLGELNAQRLRTKAVSPTLSINAKSTVEAMTAELNTRHLREDIEELSAFWTRNYYTHWGLRSSNWIYERVEKVMSIVLVPFVKLSLTFTLDTCYLSNQSCQDLSLEVQPYLPAEHYHRETGARRRYF